MNVDIVRIDGHDYNNPPPPVNRAQIFLLTERKIHVVC